MFQKNCSVTVVTQVSHPIKFTRDCSPPFIGSFILFYYQKGSRRFCLLSPGFYLFIITDKARDVSRALSFLFNIYIPVSKYPTITIKMSNK